MTVVVQAANVVQVDQVLGPSPLTADVNFTVSAGAGNRAVYLILYGGSPGASNWVVPKIDGVAMTAVSVGYGAGLAIITSIYRMVGVSAGAHTMRFETTDFSAARVSGVIVPFDGVDQATPNGSVVNNYSFGDPSPRSLAVTVAAGGKVLGAHGSNSPAPGSFALASGQTAIGAVQPLGANGEYQSSFAPDTVTAMGYSWAGGSAQSHQQLVPVLPAAGGSGGDVTASGVTVTSAASIIVGTASGQAAGIAAGVTLAAAGMLIAGSATGQVTGTLNFQAAGLEFGRRTGLSISTFALDAGASYRYTVHADGLTLGAAIITSEAMTLDSAGKLPNLASALIAPGSTYRVVAIRQADGEAATFRMTAT